MQFLGILAFITFAKNQFVKEKQQGGWLYTANLQTTRTRTIDKFLLIIQQLSVVELSVHKGDNSYPFVRAI